MSVHHADFGMWCDGLGIPIWDGAQARKCDQFRDEKEGGADGQSS